MLERRKKMMKRMVFEELERREMLDSSIMIAMASTGLTSNSYQDVYSSVVGTEIGGAAGVGMIDSITPASGIRFAAAPFVSTVPISPFAANASAVGQLTATTGANTPGIGSFATPTAGPSRAGGTGNPELDSRPVIKQAPAVDAAIESLFSEPETEVADNQDESSSRVSARTSSIKTGHRAFDFDTEQADTRGAKELAPASAR